MRYKPRPPLPSEHRLARLQTWLTLTLVFFTVHVLTVLAPRAAAQRLAQFRRDAIILLSARAIQSVTQPAQPHKPRCYDPAWRLLRLNRRRLAGAALRRALKCRDPLEQARILYALLTSAQRWIAHLVHRLRRQFTRLRSKCYPAFVTAALRATISAPPMADSS